MFCHKHWSSATNTGLQPQTLVFSHKHWSSATNTGIQPQTLGVVSLKTCHSGYCELIHSVSINSSYASSLVGICGSELFTFPFPKLQASELLRFVRKPIRLNLTIAWAAYLTEINTKPLNIQFPRKSQLATKGCLWGCLWRPKNVLGTSWTLPITACTRDYSSPDLASVRKPIDFLVTPPFMHVSNITENILVAKEVLDKLLVITLDTQWVNHAKWNYSVCYIIVDQTDNMDKRRHLSTSIQWYAERGLGSKRGCVFEHQPRLFIDVATMKLVLKYNCVGRWRAERTNERTVF